MGDNTRMSTIDKRLKKLYKKPVPNDITFEEIEAIAQYLGCNVVSGGNHMKVVYVATGTVIPIPRHGKTIGEAYIKQLKILFDSIMEEEK